MLTDARKEFFSFEALFLKRTTNFVLQMLKSIDQSLVALWKSLLGDSYEDDI